jgi:hemoglobin/transferrin/lactoferrin receptor protein
MYALDERFTLSAGLENITDVRYRPYSSGMAAPGRNVVISLRASL